MEGFKKIAKMQCFKEGGTVQRQIANYEKRERKTEEKADESQDKSMVKKGVKQHEAALHKGEPKTELKLKCGGRAKKECGTVKKYKTGGEVSNVYGAKKTAGDKNNIRKAKLIKPTKADTPSAPLTEPMEDVTMAFQKKGGKVKKMADGGVPGPMSAVDAKLAALDKQRAMEKMKRARGLGPAQQAELISQSPAAAGLSAQTGPSMAGVRAPAAMPMVDPMGAPTGPAMKKGGKARK